MATPHKRFLRNVYTGSSEPFIMKGLFQAGSTQAIEQGEMLKISGGDFVPMTADYNASADLAIANQKIKSGDLAGYYEIIVPRPGDIFEYALDTAAATAVGASLYAGATSPTESFAASGSNAIAAAVGQEHYPQFQGSASDDASPDRGTTIKSTSTVRCMFEAASSYFAALQT
jgi:hypothetical protein